MILDNNFTFDGQHCLSDMGLIYVPAATRSIIAPRKVVSYSIAGMSGTQAYGDASVAEAYTETGVLYSAGDLRSETEARALWRKVAAWLTVGRRHLIWDSEPGCYIVAEATQLHMSEYGWLDGGLQVTWLCQPYHWDCYPQLLLQTELTTAYPSVTAQLQADTGLPAPVTLAAKVTGTAALTGLEICIGGKYARLAGMELAAGTVLEITMDYPIGATITAPDGTQISALGYMVLLEELLIPATGAVASVSATYTGDGGASSVWLTAHGCWE